MPQNIEPFYISRSALLTYQTCNRKYYLSNEFQGHGLSSNYINRDLLIGSAIHRGLQHLFEHCRVNHPSGNFDETCVDEAVKVALELFDNETSNPQCNIGIKKNEDLGFVLIESKNLVEALIRTYSLVRLPLFLEEYEILEIEKEDTLDFGNDIIFLAKADGLLRRKSDNKLVVLSIKTISEYIDEGSSKTPTIQSISIDMQGNSEIYVIKDRLNSLYSIFLQILPDTSLMNEREMVTITNVCEEFNVNPEVRNYLLHCWERKVKNIEINLVQYEHLVKGETTEQPQYSGNYRRNTPLLHPYYLDMGINFRSGALDKNQFAITFGKGRPPKGWEKINIWQKMPIKQWIDILASGEIQPELGSILHKFIRASDVIFRSNEEQEEWFLSTKALVNEIKFKQTTYNYDYINKELINYKYLLAELYPKDTQRCLQYYGSNCVFYNICHHGINPTEALNDNLYQIRRPHHDKELNKFKERGFIK